MLAHPIANWGAFAAGPSRCLPANSRRPRLAQKKYDIGATDTEIKIRQHHGPYSGPASAYGVIGKTEAAYFNKINAEGRPINGRKINFISYGRRLQARRKTVRGKRRQAWSKERRGSCSSSKTSLGHAAEFGPIQEIHDSKKGAAVVRRHRRHQVERPEGFSVDHGLANPNYQSESRIYAKYILNGNAERQGSPSSIRTTIYGKRLREKA